MAEDDVTFVFSCQVAGKEGVQDTVFRPKQAAAAGGAYPGQGASAGLSGRGTAYSARSTTGAAARGTAAAAAGGAAASAGGGRGLRAGHNRPAVTLPSLQERQQQRSALLQGRQQAQAQLRGGTALGKPPLTPPQSLPPQQQQQQQQQGGGHASAEMGQSRDHRCDHRCDAGPQV